MIRRALFLLPLAVFAGLVMYFAAGLERDPSVIPGAVIGHPVPRFDLPPVGAEGDGLSSDDLKGKAGLVNVFASWCVPCLAEHPLLMEIAEGEQVMIAGLNWKDSSERAASWLEVHGNPYSGTGNDASGRVGIDFGITGVPETFVIDKKGYIRYKQTGPLTRDIWEKEIFPLVKRLEDES